MIIHDRREFAKFEKEKMNAKWDTVSETHPTNQGMLPGRRGCSLYLLRSRCLGSVVILDFKYSSSWFLKNSQRHVAGLSFRFQQENTWRKWGGKFLWSCFGEGSVLPSLSVLPLTVCTAQLHLHKRWWRENAGMLGNCWQTGLQRHEGRKPKNTPGHCFLPQVLWVLITFFFFRGLWVIVLWKKQHFPTGRDTSCWHTGFCCLCGFYQLTFMLLTNNTSTALKLWPFLTPVGPVVGSLLLPCFFCGFYFYFWGTCEDIIL